MINVSITENDALRELVKIQKSNPQKISEKIQNALVKEGVLYLGTEDAGLTLNEIADQSGYAIKYLFKLVYGTEGDTEQLEFFGALLFLGDSDCPMCGCDLERETEGLGNKEWENVSCTNCDYADSNEPDWDILPRGYEYA